MVKAVEQEVIDRGEISPEAAKKLREEYNAILTGQKPFAELGVIKDHHGEEYISRGEGRNDGPGALIQVKPNKD